jgi:hypothetical protein
MGAIQILHAIELQFEYLILVDFMKDIYLNETVNDA